MKSAYKKKLEKATTLIREVWDDLETDNSADFDTYGTRIEDTAGAIDDILLDIENEAPDDVDDDDKSDYDSE